MQAERGVAASIPRDLSWARRVHVVGVAGSGLRGMVNLLEDRGAKISGSELTESPILESFRMRGIDCRVGHASGNVRQGTNLVLISAAVPPNNPEVAAARSRQIPVLKYSQCLGHLMGEKQGIAVAGTHGKTTTTAMVTWILREAGLDPSYLIGGDHPRLGAARWGHGPHFVAEACEFDRSFLHLVPRMAVVTNLEEDHLDYFGSLKDIQKAFCDFVSLLPEDGVLSVSRDDPNCALLTEFCRSRVVTFSLRRPQRAGSVKPGSVKPGSVKPGSVKPGSGGADYWAERLSSRAEETCFRLCHVGEESVPARLRVPGEHNVRNALAAASLCRAAGVELRQIAAALSSFQSVRRRFDVLLDEEVAVVDDYAHHPTEIASVVRAARDRFPGRRLVAVFQPHQHSRLRRFLPQFSTALEGFDDVVVTNVFQSRDSDEDIRTIQSDSLVHHLSKAGAPVAYCPDLEDVNHHLHANVIDGDVVLFLGAGSVTDAAHRLAQGLAKGVRTPRAVFPVPPIRDARLVSLEEKSVLVAARRQETPAGANVVA